MVVKHEIKSQLAKLLATEDLIVEHKNVDTAQFNVHTRVLILPQWDKASNNVYDMLVGHEVGHALYTPDRNWFREIQIPPQFVNVVEDARIEKLMKRRYAGLAKSFYHGYNELNDRDFFEVNGEDISTFNLADRANLHYKIGSFFPIYFSTTEKPIIDLINDCETFDDTLSAAEALYNFCKQEQEKKKTESNESDSQENIELSGMDGDSDTSDNLSTVPDSDSDNSMEGGIDSDPSDSGGVVNGSNSLEVQTADSLEDALKNLSNNEICENVYVELPKLDLNNIIIDNESIHANINKSFVEQQQNWDESEYTTTFRNGLYEESDQEFIKFKRSAQKEVSYLVKEFECRKSANSYARATIARTGVLDTTKLHTYRFNEDIFKKVSIVPDGKNHGLVFVLDWSGSMCEVMLDTIKQLYNLLWFCRKVNLPFEVYAFTNEYPSQNETGIHNLAYEKKEGLVLVEETFSMMNLFSSRVRNQELDEQMKNIFRLACGFSHNYRCYYNIPIGMGLSGTPLNESLIALHQILPQFRKNNNLEKVQCIILTDGEAAPMRYSREIQRHWEHVPFMGSSYLSDNCVIRNRKTGYTYSCEGMGYWADVTDILLQDLRQTFSDINFIGIRLLGNRDAGQFIRRYAGYSDDSYDKFIRRWKKDKSFSIKNSGYHTYFGLSANALSNDDEFEVEEDATKTQIKRAFVKSLKNKKMNKKVLGEFIELVA